MAQRPYGMLAAIFLTAGLAPILSGLAGCGATRPNKFYVLELPEIPASSGPQYPISLLVGRVTAPHLYRDDRIIYRHPGSELGTYQTYRWAEPPAEMLENMLGHALRSTGKYASVQPLRSNAQGRYIVRGRLQEMNEVSTPSLAGRLVIGFELYDQGTGTIVWSAFYRNDEPVEGKDISGVVAALNRNAQRAIEQAVAGVDAYFAKNPPEHR